MKNRENNEEKQTYQMFFEKLCKFKPNILEESVFLIVRWNFKERKMGERYVLVCSKDNQRKKELEDWGNGVPKPPEGIPSMIQLMVDNKKIFNIKLTKENGIITWEKWEEDIKLTEKNGIIRWERQEKGKRSESMTPLGLFEEELAKYDAQVKTGFQWYLKALSKYLLNNSLDINYGYICGIEGPTESDRVIGAFAGFTKSDIKDQIDIIKTYLKGIMCDYHFRELDEIKTSHALRSAVAGIMARNMSHNIGSHILARVDINEYEKRLATLSPKLRIKIFNEIFKEFHKYLQEKSDFLAEVSTEPTRPFVPAYLFRDIILPFNEQIIVKEFIGRNEGITNFEQIKIDLSIKGKPIRVSSYRCIALGEGHIGCAEGFYKICLKEGCEKKVFAVEIENLEEDILIELPGTLGKFAIYNILEGFIRNSCKHNSQKIKERVNKNFSPVLTVYLEVNEATDGEHYICEIWDDISCVNKNGTNLVETMEKKFENPLIDEGGRLNRENWGSAEFKICAALLKNIDFMEMNKDYKKCIEVIEKNGYLGYKFYLKKPLRGISIGKKWEDWLKEVGGKNGDG